MKSFIYYIIPLLVVIATFLGRGFWFFSHVYLDTFDWIESIESISFKQILGTLLYVLVILLIFAYLAFMQKKLKKKIDYSFLEKVFLTMAIAFFIEIVLNGFLFLVCFKSGGMIAVTYYLTYIITVPIALILAYIWILNNER